ncbi:zinc finger protein 79-like isoform X2 [Lineus longissimus]|uniref:zinc finger protein 79-like isoform X2 n=1 Tax=Lineus longissimus TaxID=88925 RepID=UPI00315D96BF
MDALETEHDHPIPQNLGQEAGTLPTTCSAAIGSAEMSGSVTETGGTFPGEVPPLVMVDTPRDDSSHSELSDVQPNSPSVIHLEPGFSLVANSIVVVKCDFGSIKPQTYTYNFTIVNTTTELIELNYQPIMRPPPFQQEQQTPEPIIPLPGVIHSAESVSGLRIPIPRFGGGMSSKHGKVVKEEPVDFSITMNVSSDTEMDTLHDFGGDMTSDSLDSQRQCLNTSDRTSTTTLQDQAVGVPPEAHSRKRSAAQLPSARISSAAGTVHKSVKVIDSPQETLSFDLTSSAVPQLTCSLQSSTDSVVDLPQATLPFDMTSLPVPQISLPSSTDTGMISEGTTIPRVRRKLSLKKHDSSPSATPACGADPGEDLKCNICGKGFGQKQSLLQRHLLSHSEGRRYICQYCEKDCKTRKALTSHIRIHTDVNRFVCNICGRAFVHKNGYKYHLMSHTGEKPCKCTYCDKSFRSASRLNDHINSIHTQERIYLCDICGVGFRTKRRLTCHRKTHEPKSRDKGFSCEYCDMFFRTGVLLKIHTRTHTGEKPIKCRHCEEMFSRHSSRIVHERIHTGEKPYKCDNETCGKTFRQRRAWLDHIIIHTGERPHKCTSCDKSFATKSTLRNHRRVHNKEAEDTQSLAQRDISMSAVPTEAENKNV